MPPFTATIYLQLNICYYGATMYDKLDMIISLLIN